MPGSRHRHSLAVVISGLLLGGAAGAEPDPSEPVATRARPEVDAQGGRLGAFVLHPYARLRQSHSDNIYADPSGESADDISVTEFGAALRSNWGSHAIGISADGRVGRYSRNSNEDFEDYSLTIDGRIDVKRDSHISTRIRLQDGHEDRRSPDDENGLTPTSVASADLRGVVVHRINRVTFTLDGELRQLDHDDVAASGGAIINNDDRDRVQRSMRARAGYDVTPTLTVFAQGGANVRKYDERLDDNGFERSSDGYESGIGVEVDLTGVTRGEVFVGYAEQDYADARLSTIGGVTFDAELSWNPTGLTTLGAHATRTVEETTISQAAGYKATRYGVTADHELRRNVVLHAGVFTGDDAFNSIDRSDDVLEVDFRARYMMNRHLGISAGYSLSKRDSEIDSQDFEINTVAVEVTGKL